MTKAQWAALYDYADEVGYTLTEILKELKANGTVEENARYYDLGEYTEDGSYDAMRTFLEANL